MGPVILPRRRSTINYSACSGFYPFNGTGFDGAFDIGSSYGLKPSLNRVTLANIKDGTSNTAMYSEALRSSKTVRRENYFWNLPHDRFEDSELEDFCALCKSIPDDPTSAGWIGGFGRGANWQPPEIGGMMATLYNHALPPNEPACVNGTGIAKSLAPPSSDHHFGVNVIFCDGHIQFISQDISIDVWRNMGTRSGILY